MDSSLAFGTVSNQALALDHLAEMPSASMDAVELEPSPSDLESGIDGTAARPDFGHTIDSANGVNAKNSPANTSRARAKTARAKIIEFPRSTFGEAPVPIDELAEPMLDRPRILEVPEVAPPLPALGGITIEAIQQNDTHRKPGIDIPLQSAPVLRRMAAAVIDGVIVVAASALFGAIFWKVAEFRPPLMQLLGHAAGIPFLFWAAYQYLLMVYAGGTPGLRLAGLELARFDGAPASRRLRRWRVFASYLSAVSIGMGYAWLFLDEDVLCWHDRITHTYLAPRKRGNSAANAA